jgi:acyl transferase domain-containing protein
MSQIMKGILAMERGEIPATIGIETFNPSIDFEKAKVKVVTKMTPWPSNVTRRVSINRSDIVPPVRDHGNARC